MIKMIALMLFGLSELLLTVCSAPGHASPPPSEGKTAAITIQLTEAQLVAQADWIIVGTITDKRSHWDTEHKNIYTLVTISVEEWIKGQSGTPVTITIPGGEVGGTTQWVEDTPSFHPGDRAMLFLKQRPDSTYAVVGGGQGVYGSSVGRLSEPASSFADTISRIKSLVSK